MLEPVEEVLNIGADISDGTRVVTTGTEDANGRARTWYETAFAHCASV